MGSVANKPRPARTRPWSEALVFTLLPADPSLPAFRSLVLGASSEKVALGNEQEQVGHGGASQDGPVGSAWLEVGPQFRWITVSA